MEILYLIGTPPQLISHKDSLGCDVDKLDKNDKTKQEYKTNFLNLLKKIESQGIVEKELLIERLEETYIAEAGMIDKNNFQKKRSRINTKNQ